METSSAAGLMNPNLVAIDRTQCCKDRDKADVF
jgi:hypothetical protein